MRLGRAHAVEIRFLRIERHPLRQGDSSRGDGVSRAGQSGSVGLVLVFAAPFGDVHDFDCQRFRWAGVDTGGCVTFGKSALAHVALAHHAALGVEGRHAVGAVPDAVFAANAHVGVVLHDARAQILGVRLGRAAGHARRIEAVIAPHRQMHPQRVGKGASLDLSDPPPRHVSRVVVLLGAGNLAALAADTL